MEGLPCLLHILKQDKPQLKKVKRMVAENSHLLKLSNFEGSPLHVACTWSQSTEIIQFLFNEYPEASTLRDKYGCNAFHCAARYFHQPKLHIFRAMLDQFPHLLAEKDYSHRTPLHLACAFGSIDFINFLLELCSSSPQKLLLETDLLHRTPLCFHCERMSSIREGATRKIIEACPQSLQVANKFRSYPLHNLVDCIASDIGEDDMALIYDTAEIMITSFPQALMERDCQMNTPFHKMVMKSPGINGLDKLVRLAMEHCPDVLAIPKHHPLFPLHMSCRRGDPHIVDLLIQGSPKSVILAGDDDNEIPFFIALNNSKLHNTLLTMINRAPELLEALLHILITEQCSKPSLTLSARARKLMHHRIDGDVGLLPQDEIKSFLFSEDMLSFLQNPDTRRIFRGLLRMIEAGRSYIKSDPSSKIQGLEVLKSAINDLDCLFLHIRENPRLCCQGADDMPK